tara:strand:+ start:40 stop:894 length:855 start_codon:yes stop_codon:yes gene_type:complete
MANSYVYDYGIIMIIIYYLIHSSYIFKLNSDNFFQGLGGIIIVGVIVFLIALAALMRNWNRKNKPMQLWLMFGVLSIIGGIIYSSVKADELPEKEQKNYEESNQVRTILSLMAYIVVGFIAYNVINDAQTCSSNPELLCDKSYIVTFALVSYAAYYIINICKNFSILGFLPDGEDISISQGLISTLILSFWQFYLYMVMDGFRYGTVHKDVYDGLTRGGSQSSIRYLVYMSLIYIIFTFSLHAMTSNSCEKWEDIQKINNIKEIQANIITTAVMAILMIFSISN